MVLATALLFRNFPEQYRIIMLELKIAYKYIIVIIIGIAIFLLDLFNESGSLLNESILVISSIMRSIF